MPVGLLVPVRTVGRSCVAVTHNFLFTIPSDELERPLMATVEASSAVQQIGETAGQIWHLLDTEGPQKWSQLTKQVEAPRDAVMQAIGWLAREEKIVIEEQGRLRIVSLT